ncbi:MAG: hypothetical protein ACRDTC_09575 [Pseudonocardiaceae bacterium]
MDEQRLGVLFRDAVGDPPPASFGPADVVAASRRATARQRAVLATGTLLGVAVLACGLLVGGHLMPDQFSPGGQSPADTAAADPRLPRTLSAPPAATAEREHSRCGPVDDELAAQLRALLVDRGVAVSGPPSEVPGPCPTGSRAAAIPVAGGMFSILMAPPGIALGTAGPAGAREQVLTRPGGRALAVISTPRAPGQPVPLADQLDDLAHELAEEVDP